MCVHVPLVCLVHAEVRRMCRSPESGVTDAVSVHVGDGNGTWILWESKYS